jgi:hypothetical protein
MQHLNNFYHNTLIQYLSTAHVSFNGLLSLSVAQSKSSLTSKGGPAICHNFKQICCFAHRTRLCVPKDDHNKHPLFLNIINEVLFPVDKDYFLWGGNLIYAWVF